MIKCERKVTTTSGAETSAVICKIHNMPWLKQHSNPSTHPETNEKTKGTMMKTSPQKDKDGKFASEKKDKRGKKKYRKPSTDVSKNVDVKYRGNEKSRGEGRKNSQTGNRGDIKTPECSLTLAKNEIAWDPAGNVVSSLFPNVDSKVMSEEEMIDRAIKESLETACLEKYAMDLEHEETAEKSPEPEFQWGQVQRNLPSSEPEKASEVSDRNNNSGSQSVENLTIPGDKLQRRRWNVGQEKEENNCGRRSEIQSRNEPQSTVETPLVPAFVPKYIDKYGRIDGCTEKRIFMGKGARFKEQEYLKQLHQQKQQLGDQNLLPESQIFPPNSAETSSDSSNALAQISSQSWTKETADTDSRNCFKKSNEILLDVLDEACGYSQNPGKNTQEFNSELEDDSRFSTQSVDQFLSKMEEISNPPQYPDDSATELKNFSSEQFALLAKELTTVSSEILPDISQNNFIQPLTENLSKLEIDRNLSKNNYAPPTMQSRNGSENLVDPSEAFSAQKSKDLPEETRISCNSEETSRQIKQNFDISEQTPSQSHQNSARAGRPIVSGANFNNYQQKRHQSSGISLNRGGYHDGNSGDRNYNKNFRESQGEHDRGTRFEQNSGKPYGRDNNLGGPKGDRNSYGPRGEPRRDYNKNARHEQNPHKYEEYNSDFQRVPRDHHYSQKSDGGPNRDVQRGPRVGKIPYKSEDQNREFYGGSRGDRNFYKPDGEQKSAGEYIKKENNNEFPAHSKIDKNSPVPLQDFNVNPPVPKKEPHDWPADVAVADSQGTLENAGKNEPKDFHEISSSIPEIPDISNFASRFSAPPPVHDFAKEMISVPPVVPPPTNPYSVQTPHYPEISEAAACAKENLPYSPANFPAPPGFPCLERPAMSSCVCYTSGMSFEAKYANLLLKDPLLFRLLQQKQAENFPASLKNPPETPGNRKIYGSCPNCSCNSQSPRNFNEATSGNAKTCQSEEEERAKFQSWHRANPPPVNPVNLRYPIAAQNPESLPMRFVENIDWNPANIQNPNIPLNENSQFISCYVDPAGNVFPLNYPISHPYQQFQRPINLPRGGECRGFLPPGYENIPPDVQRLMQQGIITQLYEYPSGYPETGAHYDEEIPQPMARHVQQIPQIPMPFPAHQYGPEIAGLSRGNVVHRSPEGYHEADNHPPKSAGAEFNNQRGNEETGKVFPSDVGVGKIGNFRSIPIKGRGRARLPKTN